MVWLGHGKRPACLRAIRSGHSIVDWPMASVIRRCDGVVTSFMRASLPHSWCGLPLCLSSYGRTGDAAFSALLPSCHSDRRKRRVLAMATKKELARMPRRVWRMTTDTPQGEYLELVPKEGTLGSPETARPSVQTGLSTVYGAVSISAGKNNAARSATPKTEAHEAARPRQSPPRSEEVTEPSAPNSMKVRVLKPAQVENWQSSSFDLSTGCSVQEVTDTIPGQLFDELFNSGAAEAPTPDPKRRR